MFKDRRAYQGELLACLLALVTILIFLPVLSFDFTNYDDPYYVTENPAVRAGLTWHGLVWAFSNLQTGNWHPLTWLSHMLDAQLFGLRAGGHHFTSVLIHAGGAVALWFLLRALTGAIWRSLAVAALFALHPLHVESVAWVAEHKDVLSGFFGLMSLWAYARYARVRESTLAAQPPVTRQHTTWRYLGALVCFVLGVMSKPMLVTWPFLMLLLDYWPLGRWQKAEARGWRRLGALLWEKVPFFCVSLGVSVVTLVAQKSAGAMAPLVHLPLSLRVANAVESYAEYILKLIWPAKLAVLYPQLVDRPAVQLVGAGLIMACITAAVLWLRLRRPYPLVGWLWFLGTLVPVIGLVQVGNQSMADRYMYLPSIGLLVMLAWGLADLLRLHPSTRTPVTAVFALVLCASVAATMAQLQYWRNSETLFRHALAVTRNNAVAWNSLGFYYTDKADLTAARQCFESSLAITRENPFTWSGLAKVSLEQGQVEQATKESQQALRLKPSLAEAHHTLAQAQMKQGLTNEALAEYSAAAEFRPDSAAA